MALEARDAQAPKRMTGLRCRDTWFRVIDNFPSQDLLAIYSRRTICYNMRTGSLSQPKGKEG